ncbi:Uncharacterised protein [Mycobacterium tuberculosis]|nr:Uncharacterised protein [Mycobacterium tuberculosis]
MAISFAFRSKAFSLFSRITFLTSCCVIVLPPLAMDPVFKSCQAARKIPWREIPECS